MEPEKVFKRYDIRGKYPDELNEEFVEKTGKSIGKFIHNEYGDKIVVCRDNKESSEKLKESLIKGITSTGVDVIDIGVGPTDFASFHAMEEEAVGIQVTSSHMPLEFNGLKFLYPDGNGFLNRDLDKLKEFFRKGDFPEGEGEIVEKEGGRETYMKGLEEFVEKNGELFDRKVVVDTLGGSTSENLPEVFERLGFEVVDIGKEREEIYRNPPNPIPEQLSELSNVVEEEDAYMGVASDLDGDRVQIYFKGEWVSGDELFCVFAQLFDGKVVASVDTSDTLEKFSNVKYTRVGDPFVVDRTLKENAALSGEPNGHFCFPDFVNYNSGTLAGALAASTDFEAALNQIPENFQEKTSIEYESKVIRDREMQEFRMKAVSKLEITSTVDGVKFSHEGVSVLVRPSGSSPKIRIKSIGSSKSEARSGVKRALEVLGKA